MKFPQAKLKILYLIISIILISVLVYVLYQSNQEITRRKTGIDLRPRPFSELLKMDFSNVGDETIQDPSKCNSTRVLDQIKKDSTNPNLKDNWIGYDPKVDKLTILDNCWRQYENQYVKFRFRDLDDSLVIDKTDQFMINDGSLKSFGVLYLRKSNLPIDQTIIKFVGLTRENFLGVKNYKKLNSVIVYRSESYYHTYRLEKKIQYFINLDDKGYLYLWSNSDRVLREILSSVEIKK